MSLGSQLLRINQQIAEFRQALHGTKPDGTLVKIEYDRGACPLLDGYYSPLQTSAQPQEAGFIDSHDSVVRIPKAGAAIKAPTFFPELNKRIKITEINGTETREILLTIEEIRGTHHASAEWVLGCIAAN